MEFRCRLATAGGEIIEGVYVAESEARLRRDLEEKGLYVLSLQRRGGMPVRRTRSASSRRSCEPSIPRAPPSSPSMMSNGSTNCRWRCCPTSSAAGRTCAGPCCCWRRGGRVSRALASSVRSRHWRFGGWRRIAWRNCGFGRRRFFIGNFAIGLPRSNFPTGERFPLSWSDCRWIRPSGSFSTIPTLSEKRRSEFPSSRARADCRICFRCRFRLSRAVCARSWMFGSIRPAAGFGTPTTTAQ